MRIESVSEENRFPVASNGDPARQMFEIIPHATNPLPVVPRCIYCEAAGTVVVRAIDSSADITLTLTQGQILPLRVGWVRSAGTTAQIYGML